MDVAAYLRNQKERLDAQSKRVKDFAVFDFDHVPQQPFLRKEGLTLIDEMLRFELSGIPTHYAIIGSRGSGKTLTLKYLQRVIPAQTQLEVQYVNCRQHNTSFKVLAHLLNVPARGASLSELFERFIASRQRRTLVILDEIDLMSPKDPRREILYLLSRCAQPFMILTLANNPHVLKELDPATRSSLQPVPMHFRNYDATEIGEILRDRAQRGLHTWDDSHLRQIAALTTRTTNGDARIAIKTLYYASTQEDAALTDCFERARRDVVIDIIQDLSDATLTVLHAVIAARSAFTKDIYARYGQLCQARGDRPFSYTHFYSNLSYLQSSGLLRLVSTKVGRAYTNRVLLNVERQVVEQICTLRFG